MKPCQGSLSLSPFLIFAEDEKLESLQKNDKYFAEDILVGNFQLQRHLQGSKINPEGTNKMDSIEIYGLFL